ncbi:MAG TPA: NADP-dependent oxidoreductase [Candidatus Saccharimonadales bacterium]|nr:NADP-dependent oxidoreductase [Candidatus Saccharimonadales bacterium]
MKAAQITEYGDASVIKVNEVQTPEASEGQVLVEVHASSINPFDAKIMAGYMKDMIPLKLPATLGGDIAGVVTELGTGVSNVAVGDKVWGQANVVAGNSGAFAEFAATKANQVGVMPKDLDFTKAAALPLVGVSALQALTDHINLTAGQKLVVLGGAGGIGTIAIQIAKHIGAHVTTTASGDGIALAKQLGADEVIDYTAQDITTLVHDADAVFDTVGKDFDEALHLLKKGGVAVTMAAAPNQALADELGVTAIGQQTKVTTDALNKLCELVEAGAVTAQVDKLFALDDIAEAFRTKETGAVKGKIVITVA